jgi:electron transfer flavoprotein alpha subunit
MSILVYLEHAGDKLPKTSLSTLKAALEMRQKQGYSKVTAVLIGGSSLGAVATECAKYGADEVVTVESGELGTYLAPSFSHALVQLAEKLGASAVVGVSSARGKDLFPRVAQALDAGQASDILEVLPDHQFKRPMYAGNLIATVKLNSEKKVVTVRPTAFEPAAAGPDAASVRAESVSVSLDGSTEFISYDSVKSERPELGEAEVVVSGGRALKSKENFDSLITPLADALGAAIGASRAAVDSGYAPNDWQVGQTGKVVAPKLYIAVGISGAIQHLAGMKDSRVIVAINKDPECPMMEVADYALVGDLFQALPELTEAVRKVKSA